MNFEVRVVTAENFAKYLTNLAAIPSGDPARQSKALQSIGEAPCATTTYPFKTDRQQRSASEPGAQTCGAGTS
jgi:cytochrome c oxidase subunit 2